MARSLIAGATDEILRAVVSAPLKERGFKRSGRHWFHVGGQSIRAVTVYGSTLNASDSGDFQILFGFSYPCLGEPTPPRLQAGWCAHFNPFVMPAKDRWTIEDASSAAGREAARVEFHEAWSRELEPYLDGCAEPVFYRDHILDWPESGYLALLEADDLSAALGDPAAQHRALDLALHSLRADTEENIPDERYNPDPFNFLALPYARVLDHLQRVGRRLEGVDRDRARTALEACLLLDADNRFHVDQPDDGRELIRLGRHVGMDVEELVRRSVRR